MKGAISVIGDNYMKVVNLEKYDRLEITRNKNGRVEITCTSASSQAKKTTLTFFEKSDTAFASFMDGVNNLVKNQEGSFLIIGRQ
ncbi:hypothetical protein DRO91_05665 [Candidatus Heimdallarchaeota archaeon]|nr:MAG: hypothetical protein DRO91_05665 [Candidatus Heimdallarchaeota archaeon]